MKTMSKQEAMLSDLEMSAKSLNKCIDFFYKNGDEELANKVYDVIDFIEEYIYDNEGG